MEQQRIAHFEIRETIGFGSLGTVYLGWDTKLNRDVALKVLSPDVSDDELRKRFHLEARAIAALKHPNIVSVLDFSDSHAPEQFIALEHLEGSSLDDIIRQHGPVPEQVALCIGHEVVAALEYAHSQNIVHRDVKPDNVILEVDRVVLIDFGAIKLTESHEYIPDTDVDSIPRAVGTPGFMAPEQMTGEEIGQRADIYALGAMLYNATTLELPYFVETKDAQKLHDVAKRDDYRDPRDFQPLLTPGFCDLLADCLRIKPRHRPKNAAMVRERIEELLKAHGIEDIKQTLEDYTVSPSLSHLYNLRSVESLTRELKLALLRDLQSAIGRQSESGIKDATNRLRYVHHLFGDAERYFRVDRKMQPRLLRGRIMRRKRWILLGMIVGFATGLTLFAIRPDWLWAFRDAVLGLVKRLG